MMKNNLNVVIVIHDGHGHYAGKDDWCSENGYEACRKFDEMISESDKFIKFSTAVSPAASTIMSIESILSGVYAAKAHKIHWREWPKWDKFSNITPGDFLEKDGGYQVNGFSYLLNSENWMPSIRCYRPDLYLEFPSEKRDTHSQEAVISAFRHYFLNAFNPKLPQCIFVHSVHVYDFWGEMNQILLKNGLTSGNTIFALTADHYFPKGYGRLLNLMMQSGEVPSHHTDLTEFNTRVPFYFRFPGSEKSEVISLVSGYDLVPTILESLGRLENWTGELDGVSLAPYMKSLPNANPTQLANRIVRSDNLYPYQIGEKQGRIISVRNNRYKLIVRPDPPSSYVNYRMNMGWNLVVSAEEFYDLATDPEEMNNLIGEPLTREGEENKRLLIEYYKKSTQSIMSVHESSLAIEFKKIQEIKKLKNSVLIIQTTHNEVFNSIVKVFLRGVQKDFSVDLLMNSDNTFESIGVRTTFLKKSDESPFQKDGPEILNKYDGVIFCAHVNRSWLGNVYSKYDIWSPSLEFSTNLQRVYPVTKFMYLGLDMKCGELADFFEKSRWKRRKSEFLKMKALLQKAHKALVSPKRLSLDDKFIGQLIKTKQD
jgi:hypothetical protein